MCVCAFVHVCVRNGNFTTAAAAAERSAPRANFTCAAAAASASACVAVVIYQRFTAACGGDCVCARKGEGGKADAAAYTHNNKNNVCARVKGLVTKSEIKTKTEDKKKQQTQQRQRSWRAALQFVVAVAVAAWAEEHSG